MRILVTDLTRMRPGYVCVAGLEETTNRHVRPVLAGQLPRGLAASEGGPFGIGAIVDLGHASPRPHPPEVEDHLFVPDAARRVRTVAPGDFWLAVSRAGVADLRDVFGDDLQFQGQSMVVEPARGRASLACWTPEGTPKIWIRRDSVRFGISVGGTFFDLALNDLELYEADQQTPRRDRVGELAEAVRRRPFAASVGLTREFNRLHWLQVNNVHLSPPP